MADFQIFVHTNFEAVCELESTGGKSTGICTGHSIAELEVDWKHVI